ncbi:MAG: Ig-like domain-containing protein [Alteromonadaceae bacterium]|nr:Ig-like domain-containing protein [Alteromonadaceae bacterium]
MKIIFTAFLLICLTLLSGCNGSSGKNKEESNTPLFASSIVLTLLNNDSVIEQSFDKAEIITLQARVYDQNSQLLAGQIVEFSAAIGTLSQTSKLTNSEGLAIVVLNNETFAIGAAIAEASISDFSSTINFEFINNEVIKPLPSLTTELLLDNVAVHQFKSNQTIQITSRLIDGDNQPLTNKIINYTADIALLSTLSSLTDNNGFATVTLLASEANDEIIGAGVITASYTPQINTDTTSNNTAINLVTNRINYEILPRNFDIAHNVRIGHFNNNNEFIEGKIKLSLTDNMLSAGGTLGLSVDLVDSNDVRIDIPAQVNFSSNCEQNGHANLDSTVFSTKGNAKATFEDIDCAGLSGTDDVITAFVTLGGITHSASETITITGEHLGSIEFISAEPATILLEGSAGQQTSNLTFKVKSDIGNVLAQQKVEFSLNTTVGGITLSRTSGLTNSQGLITTQVTAGTVPTSVRVTAKAMMTHSGNGNSGDEVSVQTQSGLLSINTGLPQQRSFTIAATVLNPEADYNGETSQISVWLADNFNNPVPDGITVNFTTEGGIIEPSCTTINSHCSVTWTSAQPRVNDHRITILATALGHETFYDNNGNNTFDDNDGSAILDVLVSSGFGRHISQASGFIDMPEAWRDDNENFQFDAGETFLDFNNDGSFTDVDGKFNGPQCQGSKCSDTNQHSVHVRKALTLIMSGSQASYLIELDSTKYVDSLNSINFDLPELPDNNSHFYKLSFADLAGQTLPIGTSVNVTSTIGELSGTISTEVANTKQTGQSIIFGLTNPTDGDEESGLLTFTITTPKGTVSTLYKTIKLLAPLVP